MELVTAMTVRQQHRARSRRRRRDTYHTALTDDENKDRPEQHHGELEDERHLREQVELNGQ